MIRFENMRKIEGLRRILKPSHPLKSSHHCDRRVRSSDSAVKLRRGRSSPTPVRRCGGCGDGEAADEEDEGQGDHGEDDEHDGVGDEEGRPVDDHDERGNDLASEVVVAEEGYDRRAEPTAHPGAEGESDGLPTNRGQVLAGESVDEPAC